MFCMLCMCLRYWTEVPNIYRWSVFSAILRWKAMLARLHLYSKEACRSFTGIKLSGSWGVNQLLLIPTIIKSSSGVLLAFSENRTKSCHDHVGEHAIVLRRSLDHGETWGPLILVAKDLNFRALTVQKCHPSNGVEITTADGRRAILIHYDT